MKKRKFRNSRSSRHLINESLYERKKLPANFHILIVTYNNFNFTYFSYRTIISVAVFKKVTDGKLHLKSKLLSFSPLPLAHKPKILAPMSTTLWKWNSPLKISNIIKQLCHVWIKFRNHPVYRFFVILHNRQFPPKKIRKQENFLSS